MARPVAANSIRSYFRGQFEKHPEWLKETSNELILEQWKKDHPGKELTTSIRGNLANLKSHLREELGIRPARKRKKRGKKGTSAEPAVTAPRPRISAAALESLEIQLDHCLAMARQHEEYGLENVVKHLRAARNGVIVSQG